MFFTSATDDPFFMSALEPDIVLLCGNYCSSSVQKNYREEVQSNLRYNWAVEIITFA